MVEGHLTKLAFVKTSFVANPNKKGNSLPKSHKQGKVVHKPKVVKPYVPIRNVPVARKYLTTPGTPSALAGFMNPSAAQKEVVVQYQNYFDSVASSYQQIKVDTSDNPMSTSGTFSEGIGRVDSFELWALPQFNLTTNSSTTMVAFGVPVSSGGNPACAAQQTTVLTPTSVSDWVKVGSWRRSELFADSIILPLDDGVEGFVLGTCTVLDVDTLTLAETILQYRAVYDIAWTMPSASRLNQAVLTSTSSNAWSAAVTGSLSTEDVMSSYIRLSNRT